MELARVSVLTFDFTESYLSRHMTPTVYASACGKRLASVMKKINKKIDRKNLNFGNKTAIKKIYISDFSQRLVFCEWSLI